MIFQAITQGVQQVISTKTTTFTESQNHRMVGVGRDLCGSSTPTPLPKQGHLKQAAQELVQAGLEYLPRRRFHSLSGQPVPVLRHPQSDEDIPHVPLYPATCHHRKLSDWSSMISPVWIHAELLLITFFSSTYLVMISTMSCSIIFPRMEVRLAGL